MGEIKNQGVAKDGYEYNENSAEVLKYKEKHADIADDVAVGAVIAMHDAIVEGKTLTAEADGITDGDDIVIEMIKANVQAKLVESTPADEPAAGESAKSSTTESTASTDETADVPADESTDSEA